MYACAIDMPSEMMFVANDAGDNSVIGQMMIAMTCMLVSVQHGQMMINSALVVLVVSEWSSMGQLYCSCPLADWHTYFVGYYGLTEKYQC